MASSDVERRVLHWARESPEPDRLPDPAQDLETLRHALGARSILWTGSAGSEAIEAPRQGPREWDPIWLQDLAPGRTRQVSAEACARRPRLASGRHAEAYARTCSGSALALRGAPTLDGGFLLWLAGELEQRDRRRAAGVRAERQAQLADLGRRSAGLLHDLRNQLTLAQLEAARLSASEPQEHKALVSSLSRTLEQARELSESGWSGHQSDPLRPLDLSGLAQREARAAERVARGGGGKRVIVEGAAGSTLRTHTRAMSRTLRNLLLNALEASRAGGQVHLRYEVLRDGSAWVEVEDFGRGMSSAQVAQRFQPGASGASGTGFGTASLRECLDRLGAEVTLETSPGRGTRLRLELPAAPLEESTWVVDPDAARRERRLAQLRDRQAAIGMHDLQQASDWLDCARPLRVLLPRGLAEDHARRLVRACARARVPVSVCGARLTS